MKASIVTIGNSKNIRILKPLLEESGLSGDVELTAAKCEIKIIAIKSDLIFFGDHVVIRESTCTRLAPARRG